MRQRHVQIRHDCWSNGKEMTEEPIVYEHTVQEWLHRHHVSSCSCNSTAETDLRKCDKLLHAAYTGKIEGTGRRKDWRHTWDENELVVCRLTRRWEASSFWKSYPLVVEEITQARTYLCSRIAKVDARRNWMEREVNISVTLEAIGPLLTRITIIL